MIAMSSHDYLLLEGGESLVEFIIRQCAITDEEVEKFELAVCIAMYRDPLVFVCISCDSRCVVCCNRMSKWTS